MFPVETKTSGTLALFVPLLRSGCGWQSKLNVSVHGGFSRKVCGPQRVVQVEGQQCEDPN